MKFEVGKFYKHNDGGVIHVVCEADTLLYGHTMVAEDEWGELLPVGGTEDNAVNYHEITEDEWDAAFPVEDDGE